MKSKNSATLTDSADYFLDKLRELHFKIRDITLEQLRSQESKLEELSKVGEIGAGDVAYKIDLPAEEVLDEFCTRWSEEVPLVLVSEKTGKRVYSRNMKEDECEIRLIVDPLDGTREIMYNKERAWVLSGIAPNKGPNTSLDDIEITMQTAVRTTRESIDDQFYAVKGRKPVREVWDIDERKKIKELSITPSKAKTVEHGFFPIISYFEGFKGLIGGLSDTLWERTVGQVERGRAKIFDDQYISSAGELAYTFTGIYRGVIDIRPLIEIMGGKTPGLCSHPYDLCTKLIAEQAGCMVNCYAVYPDGRIERKVPLDAETNVAFIVYANKDIEAQVDPALKLILKERGVSM